MNKKDLLLKRAELIKAASDPTLGDEKFAEIKSEIEATDRGIERAEFLEQVAAATPSDQFDAERAAHEEAKRAGKPGTFKNLGDLLVATVNATRGQVDPRLFKAAPTGLNEGAAADGGFLVQTDIAAGIATKMYGGGEILSRCRRVTLSGQSNSLKINAINETSRVAGSRWGGVRGYWVGEGGTATASKPAFRQIRLELNKVVGLAYATDELLQDAGALNSILGEAVPAELLFQVEDAIINGTGAGQPLGILTSGATVEVAKDTNQTATTFTSGNALNMDARTYGRAGAVWLCNQDVLPQFPQMSISSQPAFMPPGGLSGSQYGQLLGRPVLPVEFCATLGTAGDVISANLGEYVVAEKGGIESASSMHVQFLAHEMAFRFTYRVDGQPLWNSALTPFKGTNTISPFVTVAVRS